MINVNMNSGLQGVKNWEQIASLIKSDSTSGVDGSSVVINGDSIVVSVTDASGTAQSITVSVPELGSATGAVDQTVLQGVADKVVAMASALLTEATTDDAAASEALQSALEELKTAAARGAAAPESVSNTANTTNTSKALFDLYALMALMVEVAQTQRDESRQIRLTENQQVQNSIKQQADSMRDAAIISLCFGLGAALVSCVMSGVSLYKQASAFNQQSNAVKTLDVPAQNLKYAQLAADKPGAAANLQAVAAKTPQAVRDGVHTEEFTAKQTDFTRDITAAKTRLDAANQRQDTAADNLRTLQTRQEPPATQEEIQRATQAYDSASAEVIAAKQNYSSIERPFFDGLDTQIKSNDATITAKQELLATKQAALKAAPKADRPAIEAEIGTIKEDLTTLQQKGEYLRAYTADQKAQWASDSTKNSDLAVAQNKYDFAKREMELGNKFSSSQQMMNRWMGIQQLSMSLSQVVNATGNMGGEMVRAAATMEGVEQTQHNEQLDQIKDLFSQAETVVQAVIQLMQAVLSAENESLMEAIRA